ncbi:hypothetical protein AVDCRST_MAG81-1063, partial [uncultured Synechococcales cyanobacterium]
ETKNYRKRDHEKWSCNHHAPATKSFGDDDFGSAIHPWRASIILRL